MSYTWTVQTTPFDGVGQINGIVEVGSRLVAAGVSFPSYDTVAVSDDGGTTWVAKTTPLQLAWAVAYSPSLDVLVIVGSSNTTDEIAYSTDAGETWTGGGALWGSIGDAVVWSEDDGLFVAGGDANTSAIYTSPDGVVWTSQTTPWDGAGTGTVRGIVRAAGSIDKWFAIGDGPGGKSLMVASGTADDWANVASGPFDNATFGSLGWAIGYSSSDDLLVAGSYWSSDWSPAATIATSTNGTAWTSHASLLDGAPAYVVSSLGALIVVGGENGIAQSTDAGSSWASANTPFPSSGITPTGDGCYALLLTDSSHAVAGGTDDTFTITLALGVGGYTPIPPPTVTYSRVYGIQITLSDDGVEQVAQLVTSQDGFTA